MNVVSSLSVFPLSLSSIEFEGERRELMREVRVGGVVRECRSEYRRGGGK